MERRFNVRIYGLWIEKGRVLVNEEIIRGKQIIKFPGGGLEYGEGPLDCLRREWIEELGMEISIESHFYTTDFFMASAYDASQVISIYYRVTGEAGKPIENRNDNEKTYWLPLSEVSEDTFTLGIDKKVGGMLAVLHRKSIGE